MISVLTLTYKRHHLLEEAIQSFLSQKNPPECEMVVINDNADVDYVFDHPNVRIINHKTRFPSISAKLEWGYKQCKYDLIYRLDDDDLLTEWALDNVITDVTANPGYDVYRSRGMFLFVDNQFEKEDGSVNNGNVYTKNYLDRIVFPDKSGDEDLELTFGNNSKIYQSTLDHTMIYRWGMGTLHISGMGIQPNNVILAQADRVLDNFSKGTIHLHPNFMCNYYSMIKKKAPK
jgi:glycosyltransferase involved in cell wall biosynthesis